jgi:hypothetical protein
VLSFDSVRREAMGWLVSRPSSSQRAFASALDRKRMDLSLAERLASAVLVLAVHQAQQCLSRQPRQDVQGARSIVDFLGRTMRC